VPVLVSYAGLKGDEIDAPVHTTQIAPTILLALGLDPAALQAVKLEQTAPLPEITLGLTNRAIAIGRARCRGAPPTQRCCRAEPPTLERLSCGTAAAAG